MALVYRFKKEKLENGEYISRPRIPISIKGKDMHIVVPALIDSGCDITVVPESIAKIIGLDIDGEKDILFAYREKTEVIHSKLKIKLIGRLERESVDLEIPILIALGEESENEPEVTLGVQGFFDKFEITFKKTENKIILKHTPTREKIKS